MKHRNWFWGIFFLAAAIFVIASQVGAFVQIGFWSIAAAVLLAAIFVSSLVDINFFGIFISAALLYIIFQRPFNFIGIPFWQLILAAVLASIGCSMIFHGHRRWNKCGWNNFCKSGENISGDNLYARSSFSESCRYLHSDSLTKARLESSFGKMSVYFDEVTLSPDGAEASLDVKFGEMALYIPKGWRVTDNVYKGFGTAENDTRNTPADANAPALTLTGKVAFGNLEVHYV